jgi:hypothetical protein
MTPVKHISATHPSDTPRHTERQSADHRAGRRECDSALSFCCRLVSVLLFAICLGWVFAPDAFAASSDVGQNVGELLKHYAGEVYGGIVASFSLVFLWNRRYVELATFLFAAVVVAWMVFAPDQIGKAAEYIGKQIFD